MVKHSIDDNDIELISITTDEDLQEMPEMEKCIITVNDVETESTMTHEDSDSLSQILMGTRKQEVWYQSSCVLLVIYFCSHPLLQCTFTSYQT